MNLPGMCNCDKWISSVLEFLGIISCGRLKIIITKKKKKEFLLWTNYPTLLQKVKNSFKAHSFPSHTHIPLKNGKSRSFSGKSSHFRDQKTNFCFEVRTIPREMLQSTGGVHGAVCLLMPCLVRCLRVHCPAGAMSMGAGCPCWCSALSQAQLLDTPVPGFSAAKAVLKYMPEFMVSSASSSGGV